MIAFAHRVLMLACLVASVAITGCAGVTSTMAQQNPLHDPLEDQTGQNLYESGMRIAGQGDYIRAEQYFTAARDHGFPEERVLPMLMQVCIHSARYSAALGYAEPYLETHPENWGLRMLMATIQMGLGNPAAARLSLEHVVAEAPDEAIPHYMLGVLLRDDLGDEAAMRTQFERYLALAPDGSHASEAREALGLIVTPVGPVPVRLSPDQVPPPSTPAPTSGAQP